MEPLSPYEIQELLDILNRGTYPVPIGSMWSSSDASHMFIVLHHANLPTEQGPRPCLVLQAIPDGAAWIQPTEEFLASDWHNIGFVWDRTVDV